MKVEQLAKGLTVRHPHASNVDVRFERKATRPDGSVEVSGYYANDPRTQVGFVVPAGTDLTLR